MDKSKSLRRRALLVLGFSFLMLVSFAFGVYSTRRHTRLSKIARALIERTQQRFSRKAFNQRGVWHRARDAAGGQLFSKEQQEAIDKLPALPYLQGYTAAPAGANVTIHDERRAHDGLNFVVSGDSPRAFLMDMKGRVVHTWRKTFDEVWPGRSDLPASLAVYKTYWRRAYLLPNGDLLAIFMYSGLIKLDKDSNLLWAYEGPSHHDLFVDESGSIHLLTFEKRTRDDLRLESWTSDGAVWEDFINILSPEGREIRRVSILDAFLNSAHASLLEHMKESTDILHTNTIRPIQADEHPIFKKGQVLVSLREIHALAAVDLQQEKVTWVSTGMWKYQHEPRLLNSGNVLLFDNRGNNGRSRAIEFNPVTQEVAWSYQGEPAEAFHSREAGSLQRLANGNTLITESEKGRGFEVTPEGAIVWEFLNPHRAGERNELIAALWDVVRVDPKHCDWLERGAKPSRP